MEKRLNKWHSYIEGDSAKTEEGSKDKVDTSTKTPADVVATSNSSSNSAIVSEDSVVQGVNKDSTVQDENKDSVIQDENKSSSEAETV